MRKKKTIRVCECSATRAGKCAHNPPLHHIHSPHKKKNNESPTLVYRKHFITKLYLDRDMAVAIKSDTLRKTSHSHTPRPPPRHHMHA
jgi:hypothetical protein